MDEPVARLQGNALSCYLPDKLGSVRDIQSDAGAVVNTTTLKAFGAVASETNPLVADRFKFTGREYEPESGLYYYRARYYDPVLGRFLSEDPITFEAGDANLYRYVGNSPGNGRDPGGRNTIGEKALITAYVSGGILGGYHGYQESGPGILNKGIGVFVGYQAYGTPGRYIQDTDWVKLDGKRYDIKAQVHQLSGYSAHADQSDLLRFVEGMPERPKAIRLVHGEDDAKAVLKTELEKRGYSVV